MKIYLQGTKRFRSDSPGLVDFVVRLVASFTCPTGKLKFSGKFFFEIDQQEHCKSSKIFGLVEMTSGLVHLGYSFPEGQDRKLNFLPCLTENTEVHVAIHLFSKYNVYSTRNH